MRLKSFLVLAGLCLLSIGVRAVPPAPGQSSGAQNTCHVNSSAREVQVTGGFGAPVLIPPAKNFSVLVLRVQFSNLSFGGVDHSVTFFQDVQNYFSENSYGVFRPTFTISSVFTLPNTQAFYGNNCGQDVSCNASRLITDAVAAADPSINFSGFDQVMIYHAGFGEESTGTSSHIWSMYIDPSYSSNEKSFVGATIVPELESGASALGVLCHEYGHQLGLPDLYDTSVPGGQSTVGAWDLMDYPWTGSPAGSNPPHLGAWSKRILGFGTTEVLTSSGMVTLSPMELGPGKSIEIFRSGPEYFLLEYRLKASTATYDKALPQSAGLAVWHVDETVVNNSTIFNNNTVNAPRANGIGHRGVDLVEADGNALYPPGSADLFLDGQTLAAPYSNLFNGAVSSLVMTGIEGISGPLVDARILFLASKIQQTVARSVSYPNPSNGVARAGAPAGTWSTLRLQLSRPVAPSALKATIYSILGQRVVQILGADFVFRVDLSRDYEWIYEYDWNGKDETGGDVASGVYYLQFDVDGEKIRKPIVVQR